MAAGAAAAAVATGASSALPDDASAGSSTDCSEGRAGSRLAAIKEVLDQIFDYYSIPSSTSENRVLTSARFNKMLLDSKVIDDRLSNGKADLVFAKVCGHASNPMGCEQFLDAVVQLAREKYPQLPRVQGIEKLYCEHFFSFTAGQEEPLGGLTPEIVEVMSEARSGLQAIYRTYFVDCLSSKEGVKPVSNPQSAAQDAWVQFLSDYEVLPEFAQKPMVFAAFRESSQLAAVPTHMRQQILGNNAQDIGRFFTYVNFALALMSLARRCFAEFCAGSLIRLFQWMDDSKGHILAASRGSISASTLRILGQFGPSHDMAQSLLASATEQATGPRTSRSSVSSVGMRRSVSLGTLRKSIGGIKDSPASSTSGLPPPELKGCPSTASASTVLARAARISEALGAGAEELVHQLFSYYAALGDTLNQTHLTLMNFSHFLRDCGLVGSEGRSDFFDFVPAERVQQARRSLSGTGPRRSGSSGSAVGSSGAQQHRGSRARPSQAPDPGLLQCSSTPGQSALERTPPSKRSSVASVAAPKDLPLRVYQQPPITQVDADLIFVQAIHNTEGHDAQRALAKRRPSLLAARGNVVEKQGQRNRMTLAAFGLAIQTLSIAVFKGDEEEEVELREMVEEFCTEVLEPLSKILLGGAQQEVVDAANLLNKEEATLFSKSRPGLERIFSHYARITQKQPQQHWTPDDISKFVRDFGLAAELSQRPVQQIFRTCVSHERFDLKEMSFGAFQLALVIMAQRIHSSFKHSALDKVVLLLHRINTASREEGHMGPKPPNSGTLIPGLPPLTSLVQQDAKMLSVSVQPALSTPPGKTASLSRASSSTPPSKAAVSAASSTRKGAESWAGILEAEGIVA